jgi:hypothetical protein
MGASNLSWMFSRVSYQDRPRGFPTRTMLQSIILDPYLGGRETAAEPPAPKRGCLSGEPSGPLNFVIGKGTLAAKPINSII